MRIKKSVSQKAEGGQMVTSCGCNAHSSPPFLLILYLGPGEAFHPSVIPTPYQPLFSSTHTPHSSTPPQVSIATHAGPKPQGRVSLA